MATKKQGAYGKVKVLTPSWRDIFFNGGLKELAAMAKFRRFRAQIQKRKEGANPDTRYCFEILERVSRSFALVIQILPEELKVPICVYYLVLRALDTIEDDMTAFSNIDIKKRELENFSESLNSKDWKLDRKVGEGDESALLKDFHRVSAVFRGLATEYRTIIANTTKEMGRGMAQFIGRDLAEGTKTIEEYDLYCHYVAGIVGIGLSKMFAASGVEPALSSMDAAALESLSNHMGLFLQKTNIIRDFIEDFVDGRSFWPKEIWSKHAPSLGAFCLLRYRGFAVECLNSMISNALGHFPYCIRYLNCLKNPEIFRFCAAPQLMALATLQKIHDNPDVFEGVVKIRKGTAALILTECSSFNEFGQFAHLTVRTVLESVEPSDPTFFEFWKALTSVQLTLKKLLPPKLYEAGEGGGPPYLEVLAVLLPLVTLSAIVWVMRSVLF